MYEWVRYEKDSRNQDWVRHRLKIKTGAVSMALSFIAQKIFALEQMVEWFSEVGSWLLRIRTMNAGFFKGLVKVFGRIWTNCFPRFRMFGFSMAAIGS